MNFLNGIIHLPFLNLSIIIFRDFKMKTWSWSVNSIQPSQIAQINYNLIHNYKKQFPHYIPSIVQVLNKVNIFFKFNLLSSLWLFHLRLFKFPHFWFTIHVYTPIFTLHLLQLYWLLTSSSFCFCSCAWCKFSSRKMVLERITSMFVSSSSTSTKSSAPGRRNWKGVLAPRIWFELDT